jgi:hypothetical protein
MVNGEGVPLPRFHLQPDEELVVGLEPDASSGTWNLRIELLLRVSERMLHRYGPIWLEPETIREAKPESLEEFIRETLAADGYTEESLDPEPRE